MSAIGFRLLRLLAWRGARWYVRRRSPSWPAMRSGGLLVRAGALALAVLARRAAS